jgi:crotonobetainyl-CoA:carnitine CoA-transferase CaiB-like acyl-CoA transferase
MGGLLDGVRVVDWTAGVPECAGLMAGRILADLGAEVVLVEPPGGVPERSDRLRFLAWNVGKRAVTATADDPLLADLLAGADIVLAGGPPEQGDPGSAVWVAITPFGLSGPRAGWRASDLTLMATGGNVFPTGDPDRPPLRCTEPASAAHGGPEIVIAALTALAGGVPQVVDVSLQETVLMANMGGPSRFVYEHYRGDRRGAFTGRTRESWRCKDGWVSFGLRGGGARVKNLQTLTQLYAEDGLTDPALTERDWSAYDHRTIRRDELDRISDAVQQFFDRHTMSELYDLAVRTGLMLAPANSPREIDGSAQLASRGFFGSLGEVPRAPQTFVVAGPEPDLVRAGREEPRTAGWPDWSSRSSWRSEPSGGDGAWSGLRILELGSGAAGPLATGYFADHGATVIRIESASRPDFLRSYTTVKGNPDGSAFFAALNPGKLAVSLDLKQPRARAIAERLVEWADVVSENFAPGAMDRLGLGRDRLRELNPSAVLASACLQGQTGPHRDYPGFGGQGAALSGYTFLTGWPDRAPLGPAGTITDSLAPRFSAAAIAAALLHRRRTGKGADLDLSQVEAAVWTLSPWLMEWTVDRRVVERDGNRHPTACPHGVFPCAGEDRWVTVAIWTDEEWRTFCRVTGIDGAGLESRGRRLQRAGEAEDLVAGWTRRHGAAEVADLLQEHGIEAGPVSDWGDLLDDPQLLAREHFVRLPHAVLGDQPYEQRGFRLTATPGGPRRAAPLLGEHTEHVLRDILGLTDDDIAAARAEGALS